MLPAGNLRVSLSFETPRIAGSFETDSVVAQVFPEADLGMSHPLRGVEGRTLRWACSAGFGPVVEWAPTGRCRRV